VAVLSSRPGRLVTELTPLAARAPDRAGAITTPEFGALRAEAMRALREGSR
jgi:hypothetical protein